MALPCMALQGTAYQLTVSPCGLRTTGAEAFPAGFLSTSLYYCDTFLGPLGYDRVKIIVAAH